MNIPIGKKVKIIRTIRGWRQIDLARRANLDPATLIRFERGGRNHHYSTREKIEAAFGFGLSDPIVEAAFAILSNDAAQKEAVIMALTYLEQGHD